MINSTWKLLIMSGQSSKVSYTNVHQNKKNTKNIVGWSNKACDWKQTIKEDDDFLCELFDCIENPLLL